MKSVLLSENYITSEELERARRESIKAKKPLHSYLIDSGNIREEEVLEAVSSKFSIDIINIDIKNIDKTLSEVIKLELLKKYKISQILMANLKVK